ncbi:hypothetical protein ABT255_30160 [Streptomyces mirabilis]|uniref:hypothetical protein n=1 Tax=Streptomyces mirabilis TaxID=68239 RepID=UPI003317A62B
MTGTPMQVEHQPPLEAPVEQGLLGEPAAAPRPPYEMRPLLTEQDRDAVAELVNQRMKWLDQRWLAPPYPGDAASLFREQWVDSAALFEDGRPVGCLRLDRQPTLPRWDAEISEPSVLVSLAFTAPDRRTDLIGRLMTLWVQDFASRLGMMWARCEVPAGAPGSPSMHLLEHLKNRCGWQFVRSATERAGRPLALLQLPAKARRLEPLICCTVPLQPADSNVAAGPGR